MLFKEKFYLNELKLFICETVTKGKLTLIHVITALGQRMVTWNFGCGGGGEENWI